MGLAAKIPWVSAPRYELIIIGGKVIKFLLSTLRPESAERFLYLIMPQEPDPAPVVTCLGMCSRHEDHELQAVSDTPETALQGRQSH